MITETDYSPITPKELADADRILSRFSTTRASCPPDDVPCPFVNCRHHLWMTHNSKCPDPDHAWIESPVFGDDERTCSLRFADTGPHTLEFTAIMLGITRERVRQIERAAFRILRHTHPDVLAQLLATINEPPEHDTSKTDWAEPEQEHVHEPPERIEFSKRLNAILLERQRINNQACKRGKDAKREQARSDGEGTRPDGNDPDSEPVACRACG